MSIKAQYAGLATGLVSMATVFGVAPAAHAFDFKLSGQVNRAIIAADNGKSSGVGFVDNHSSNTRFGFSGSQDVNPNYSIGFDYVIGLGDNQSSNYDINHSGSSGVGIQNRQANVYLKGDFGKFTLGKQDGAANSTSKVDYSGLTDLGGGSVVDDYFGGLSFVNGAGAITSVKNVYSNFDALSRVNAIRYDTPNFNGATLSVSYDEGQAIEVAPRYEHKFADGVKFGAALDYVDSGQRNQTVTPTGRTTSGNSFKEYGGSASVLLPSGLNFFAQYKRRNYSNTTYSNGNSLNNAQSYSGGIGYIVGKNHFQGFFGQTDDLYTSNSQARNYGVAYRYDLMKAVNMYASYHHLTANNLDTNAKDINLVFAGVRVKFF